MNKNEVIDGTAYYLAIKTGSGIKYISFNKKKKTVLAGKRGIALHYEGSDEVRKWLSENPEYYAVEVPKDADKKYTKR
jgi:hypothetical protein